MNIGIIGKGNVGTALADGLSRAGHVIRFGDRHPSNSVRDAAAFGEVVILAVPYKALPDVAGKICGEVVGKPLVDVTNILDETMDLAFGCTTSGAEELQHLLPKTPVVKAFNTVFAKNQRTGQVEGRQLTAFIASDDESAKRTVASLAADIGFAPVDCGPLKAARYLEPMAVLLISLSYRQGMGADIGYRLEGARAVEQARARLLAQTQ